MCRVSVLDLLHAIPHIACREGKKLHVGCRNTVVSVACCNTAARQFPQANGCGSKPCTPGEHQTRWQLGVHPLQDGIAIGHAPWPHGNPTCLPAQSLSKNQPDDTLGTSGATSGSGRLREGCPTRPRTKRSGRKRPGIRGCQSTDCLESGYDV